MSEFIVTSDYQGYIFVGWAKGQFDVEMQDGSTEKRDYFNMYVIAPVSDYKSDDYEAAGFKAEKKRCVSDAVWKDLKPGDRVNLFFDDKKRVVMVALDN